MNQVNNFVKQIDEKVFNKYKDNDAVNVHQHDVKYNQENDTYTLILYVWKALRDEEFISIDLGKLVNGKMTRTLDQVFQDIKKAVK